MNLNLKSLEDVSKKGVYCIRNTVNGKMYIGSSVMTILKRLQHHHCMLVKGDHKNEYLQRAWNKYGEENFSFEVVENCPKEECLKREQFWIDYYKEKGHSLYNINQAATGTSGMTQEVINKRSRLIREFHSEASKYYDDYKKEKISLNDIPEKYRKMILSYFGKEPWNKGKHYDSTDHLKVPKLNKGDNTNRLNSLRSKMSKVYVYDTLHRFLGKWKNSAELFADSLTEDFILKDHMQLRNPNGRNNLPAHIISRECFLKNVDKNTLYKGLYFTYKPNKNWTKTVNSEMGIPC